MGLKERRQREAEARRDQILDAARRLLFEKGFHAASIHEIARSAELAVGTLYFYFKSKMEIFATLQEEGLALLAAGIRQAVADETDPAEKLRHIAHTYLRFSRDQKDYFDIINFFIASPDEILPQQLKSRVDTQGQRILTELESVITEGKRQGVFEAVRVNRYAIMFWGALHGLIQFRKLQHTVFDGEDPDAIFLYAVERLIKGLQKGHGR